MLTIPVEEISAQARRVDVRRALLVVARMLGTVLLSVPYVAGWTLRKAWMGLWACLTMLGTAAAIGWRDAGRAAGAKGGADV